MKAFPAADDMELLRKKCEKLASFKANVLRSSNLGKVEWERKDDKWEGGAHGVPKSD